MKTTHLLRSLDGAHFGMKFISVPVQREKQMQKKKKNMYIGLIEKMLNLLIIILNTKTEDFSFAQFHFNKNLFLLGTAFTLFIPAIDSFT